ncbi:MAG: hypothetical protein IKJ99_06130 [Oscillospiraceae bacterium]|nr:hypothetical protein [Oscillospiraceae bacterium]
MTTIEKLYCDTSRLLYNEMDFSFFPQVEASEILYRIIRLEDIYLPLRIEPFRNGANRPGMDIDIDELIRRIDEKIAALEKEIAEEEAVKNNPGSETQGLFADKAAEPAPAVLHQIVEASDVPDKENAATGLRMLLRANPGAGKSTFCKRLALAYLNQDQTFFDQLGCEKPIFSERSRFPFLLSCKHLANFSESEITGCSFQQLAYKLWTLELGNRPSSISEEAFTELIEEKISEMILILDGWDDILSPANEAAFGAKFNTFLEQNPTVDLLMTIRHHHIEPNLDQGSFQVYKIKDMTDEDVRIFTKNWCDKILRSYHSSIDPERLAEEIIESPDTQIKNMRTNPLDLSLLLIVSKNGGKMPSNKAELFYELVNLYIVWNTRKSGILTIKSLRILLAYIAFYFTIKNKTNCSYDELDDAISRCRSDLEWSFSQDLTSVNNRDIIVALSHSGILSQTYDGNHFSFAQFNRMTHRQFQEYLTAYAIHSQYVDEEYAGMSPSEFFEDKYDDRNWSEVILFISLMENAWLRQEIIRQLIRKAQGDSDNYIFSRLLFDMVLNGADIRSREKHEIFDLLFANQISEPQISKIFHLIRIDNRITAEFTQYIDRQYAASLAKNDSEYGFAKAVIEASRAVRRGESPLYYAEQLITENCGYADIITGTLIISVLAWCKYVSVRNEFSKYFANYRMSYESVGFLREYLDQGTEDTELVRYIQDIIVANFVDHRDVFSEKYLHRCYEQIGIEDGRKYEYVLSVAPIFDSEFSPCQTASEAVKEKYRKRFGEEKQEKKLDDLVFTFSVCVSLGCWNPEEIDSIWNELKELYRKANLNAGRAWFGVLNIRKSVSQLVQLADRISAPEPPRSWMLFRHAGNQWTYRVGANERIITCPEGPVTPDAASLLHHNLSESIQTDNNLAYLLRRGEISRIELIDQYGRHDLTPEDLLKEGCAADDLFCMINYALSISGTSVNAIGNPEIGLAYLNERLDDPWEYKWIRPFSWWLDLVCERRELEGLIVMQWLAELQSLPWLLLSLTNKHTLINLANSVPEGRIRGMDRFISDLKTELEKEGTNKT